jgi:hypothetical protein
MDEPIILPPVNNSDALKIGEDINGLLDQISSHQLRLSHSYARLGCLMLKAKNEQFWIPLGYERFSSMIEDIGKKIDRRRSQMYAILSVAEVLSPYLAEEELEMIGIAKSHELRRFVKQSGQRPDVFISIPCSSGSVPLLSEDSVEGNVEAITTITLSDYAADSDVTAALLRVEVNKLLHQEEQPQGYWYENQGFYLLPDEKKEIEQFWAVGRTALGLSDEVSEHTWKKEVMLAAARECVSAWIAEAQHAD